MFCLTITLTPCMARLLNVAYINWLKIFYSIKNVCKLLVTTTKNSIFRSPSFLPVLQAAGRKVEFSAVQLRVWRCTYLRLKDTLNTYYDE